LKELAQTTTSENTLSSDAAECGKTIHLFIKSKSIPDSKLSKILSRLSCYADTKTVPEIGDRFIGQGHIHIFKLQYIEIASS